MTGIYADRWRAEAERRAAAKILPDLTPIPGIEINHPLDILTDADLAWVRTALAELVRVQRKPLSDGAVREWAARLAADSVAAGEAEYGEGTVMVPAYPGLVDAQGRHLVLEEE